MDMDTIGGTYLLGSPGVVGKVAAIVLGLLIGLWYFEDANLDDLRGKRVLVTGASRGVGEQVAYSMAGHGATVTVTARSYDRLVEVSRRCTSVSPSNTTHHVVAGDMADMEATRAVVQEAIKVMGGLDILVLNHITTSDIEPYTGSPTDLEKLDTQMDINFRSHAHLAAHALPELIAHRGRIVVVNSLVGRVPHPFLAPYVASKFALDGFFTSLRAQFMAEGTGVSVTLCYLGLIGTDQALAQLHKSGSHRLLRHVRPEEPGMAAQAIVKAAASRRYEVHFPFTIRPLLWLHAVCPRVVDWVMRLAAERWSRY